MNLVVRTHQDSGVWVGRRGRIEGDDGSLHRALGGALLSPMAGEPPSRLARRRAGRAGADVACYFAVPDPGDADGLADRLREHDLVEFAYVKPPIALPGAAAAQTHDLRPNQGYLDDPPRGIGAAAAWKRTGGRGDGVRLIDVEGSWRLTHEDLPRGGLAGGRPTDDVERRNHGTNVLGMLAAVHDGRGISGICPDAAIRTVSYQPEGRWGSARAIKHAADLLRPGDIMLLEMMRPGPRTPPGAKDALGYLPVDYWPDDLTAIQYATSLGVIVVEAAGNGAEHLDDEIYAGAGPGFRPHRPNPFLREGLDSGAVVVGAGARRPAATTGPIAHGWTSPTGAARSTPRGGAATSPPPAGSARARTPSAPATPRTAGTPTASAARRAPRRWWPARSPACRASCAPPEDARSPRIRPAAPCARPARRRSGPPTGRSSASATALTSPS